MWTTIMQTGWRVAAARPSRAGTRSSQPLRPGRPVSASVAWRAGCRSALARIRRNSSWMASATSEVAAVSAEAAPHPIPLCDQMSASVDSPAATTRIPTRSSVHVPNAASQNIGIRRYVESLQSPASSKT